MNTPLDVLTMGETIELITRAIESREKISHVALNVAKLVRMRDDPLLRRDVTGADIIGVDGMGILWAGRLLGCPVPERVTGIDLMNSVLAECAKRSLRPYFLGATPEVVATAAKRAADLHSGLVLAGYRDGYFKADQEAEIVAAINASGADCVFIGMPTPRKERFLAATRQAIDAPFVMGVGGSFDVMAGKVSRAPKWMMASGLEWLYRVIQEPRRMAWRYIETNSRFAVLLTCSLFSERLLPAKRKIAR